MKVFLSPLAEYKLTKLLVFLEDEWGKASKVRFLNELEEKINQISRQPKSAPLAEGFDEIHWSVITSHSSIYYRILKQEVEVITITDNRQILKKSSKRSCGILNQHDFL